MSGKDTFKYHLKQGRRVVHRGVTNNLERREDEHQEKLPASEISQVGRRTTREKALKWERAEGKRPNH